MRIRSIKPEFWRSDDIDALDWHDRLLFIGLWSYVDDNGVGRDKVANIAADIFAGDLSVDPTETLRRVSLGLETLYSNGQIARYRVAGKGYLHVTAWESHQLVKNPNKARYPLPTCDDSEPTETLRTSSVDPTESLPTGAGEQGNRGAGEQGELPSPTDVGGPTDPIPGFDAFWDAYAKKQGRKDAEGKYRIALRKPGVTPDFLLRAALDYVTYEREHNEGGRFVMDASRWLHGEHWRDERKTPRLAPVSNVGAHLKLAAELAERERGPQPPRQIGQRP